MSVFLAIAVTIWPTRDPSGIVTLPSARLPRSVSSRMAHSADICLRRLNEPAWIDWNR